MISEDTKATLFLTGRFSGEDFERGDGPLSLNEYNRLAVRLHEAGLRPSDLINVAGADVLLEIASDEAERIRLERILKRGIEAAMRLSQWESSGVRVLGRSDESYPAVWVERLGAKRPPIIYCIGDPSLINGHSIGVVGSRDVDDSGRDFAINIARSAVRDGFSVISGFARGVDQYAMSAALDAGGITIGIVADSLLRNASKTECYEAISEGRMTLVSTCSPDITRFLAWRVMDRNKYIYAASEATVVVETALKTGGTWSGATEAIKNQWSQVLVRANGEAGSGRKALESLGATAIDETIINEPGWHATKSPASERQPTLFDKLDDKSLPH